MRSWPVQLRFMTIKIIAGYKNCFEIQYFRLFKGAIMGYCLKYFLNSEFFDLQNFQNVLKKQKF